MPRLRGQSFSLSFHGWASDGSIGRDKNSRKTTSRPVLSEIAWFQQFAEDPSGRQSVTSLTDVLSLVAQDLREAITMKTLFVQMAGLVFLLVCPSAPSYGQTEIDARASEESQVLVKGHVAWRSKLSSPGAAIRAKEVERQGSLVRYQIYVSGLPSTELYTALSWPITQAKPSTVMEGVSLGKDGIAMCAGRTPEQCGDSSKKDDPIDFVFNAGKGEPYPPRFGGWGLQGSCRDCARTDHGKGQGLHPKCRTITSTIRIGVLHGYRVSAEQ